MKKIRIVGIASVILVVGIVALDFNNNRIEHINDQLATNPPAAGDGRSFGDIERARSRINDTTAGFHTKPASLSVYKEIEGNVTSFSDIPTRNYSASTGRGEIIQVNASNPPTKPKPDVNQQVKHSKWESQFAMFPQDKDGWSIITPAVDSRMIYVSSTDGNDSKAKAYFSKDIPDPRNPPSSVVAFKTIEKALKLQRDGYPDWILLKKGDKWLINNPISLSSGRSIIAPMVLSFYGDSTQRPLIKTGVESGIKLIGGQSFISIIGIEFYANQRDPESSDFLGWSKVDSPVGLRSFSNGNKPAESITSEDNIFRFFSNHMEFNGESKHKNIVIRRNQFLNSYSTSSHSQGIYAHSSSILLEENLFDHNGWFQQNYEKLNSKSKGQATYFNHNAYLANMSDTVIISNIFSRSSSIGIKLTSNSDKQKKINQVIAKNILIDNNLIIGGEVGISAGGNTDFNNGFRWQNMTITNNVFLNIGKSQPSRRNLAWYVEANDWDGGVISGNYLLCNSNSNVSNVLGILVKGRSRNISVQDNILYGIKGSENRMINTDANENKTGVLFKGNAVSKDASCGTLTFSHESFIDRFITDAKKQSYVNWNPAYTASKFNENAKSSFIK